MAKSNKSTAVAVQEQSHPDAIKFKADLVPSTNADAAKALLAFQELLETPFISGTAAAEAETVVTIVKVAEGEVESLTEPGTFKPQYLYLLSLQTPLEYKSSAGEIKSFAKGDLVLLGLAKSGKVRDTFAELVRRYTEAGEVIPNLLVVTVPSKKPGFAPAIAFKQIAV
jgi:hypothetical protein